MAHVETLSGADIEVGRMLWKSLRKNEKFPVEGILWMLKSESELWHLLIATPRVDEVGPKKSYEELANITRAIPVESPQLLKIELMSPKRPLYQALRSVFGKTASVEGARLGNTQVAGMYIEDAYLYEIR